MVYIMIFVRNYHGCNWCEKKNHLDRKVVRWYNGKVIYSISNQTITLAISCRLQIWYKISNDPPRHRNCQIRSVMECAKVPMPLDFNRAVSILEMDICHTSFRQFVNPQQQILPVKGILNVLLQVNYNDIVYHNVLSFARMYNGKVNLFGWHIATCYLADEITYLLFNHLKFISNYIWNFAKIKYFTSIF